VRGKSEGFVTFLMTGALVLTGSGCGSLKWQVFGPLDGQAPSVGPLRIDVRPVDTTELEKGHPFRWRGSETAGFMLFDLKITNTGERDLLCQVGHLDFPGVVSPKLMLGNFLEGAMSTWQPPGTEAQTSHAGGTDGHAAWSGAGR